MSGDETYNGWPNYATWRINNDILIDYLDSLEQERRTFRDERELANHLSQYLYELVEESATRGGYAAQLAMGFLDDVNWEESASHNPDLIESDDEEEEEEDD